MVYSRLFIADNKGVVRHRGFSEPLQNTGENQALLSTCSDMKESCLKQTIYMM